MQYSDNGTGVTTDSLTYYLTVRPRIGEIIEADIRFPGFTEPFDPYLMTLRDTLGNEIRLSGCTAGYNGEGPRGAMDVLINAGFDPHEARRVIAEPELQLRRTPSPSASPRAPDRHREHMLMTGQPHAGRSR